MGVIWGMIGLGGLLAVECQERKGDWSREREALVELLKEEGITDTAVLRAMGNVPRHLFVPEPYRQWSYENRPLPIGHDQTISQPYIVAYMTQALRLKPTDKVLEVGTGSGYHAAVMSLLAREVHSIEIVAPLAESARRLLDSLGYRNIKVYVGDGYNGLPEVAPFDAICITAAPPYLPQPLLDQLAVGGRLIAPIGEEWQNLVLVERTAEGLKKETLIPVLFVPMTGEVQKTTIPSPR